MNVEEDRITGNSKHDMRRSESKVNDLLFNSSVYVELFIIQLGINQETGTSWVNNRAGEVRIPISNL